MHQSRILKTGMKKKHDMRHPCLTPCMFLNTSFGFGELLRNVDPCSSSE